jgi:hypothetical protein
MTETATHGQISPDGLWWWDLENQTWQPIQQPVADQPVADQAPLVVAAAPQMFPGVINAGVIAEPMWDQGEVDQLAENLDMTPANVSAELTAAWTQFNAEYLQQGPERLNTIANWFVPLELNLPVMAGQLNAAANAIGSPNVV